MAVVRVGPRDRVDGPVSVGGGVCVRTGRPTSDRIVLRGSTTPGWVHVLLLVSVLGWIYVLLMAGRRYAVGVPFSHEAYRRWIAIRAAAWVVGLAALATAVLVQGDREAGVALVVAVVALVVGVVNGAVGTIGVTRDRDGVLRLHGVHPRAARAIRAWAAASPQESSL